MTFCMHKVSVFRGVSVRGEFAVKLGILKRHLLIAMGAFHMLLGPLEGLKLAAGHRLSTFIVPELFGYFPAEGEEQERIPFG